ARPAPRVAPTTSATLPARGVAASVVAGVVVVGFVVVGFMSDLPFVAIRRGSGPGRRVTGGPASPAAAPTRPTPRPPSPLGPAGRAAAAVRPRAARRR